MLVEALNVLGFTLILAAGIMWIGHARYRLRRAKEEWARSPAPQAQDLQEKFRQNRQRLEELTKGTTKLLQDCANEIRGSVR